MMVIGTGAVHSQKERRRQGSKTIPGGGELGAHVSVESSPAVSLRCPAPPERPRALVVPHYPSTSLLGELQRILSPSRPLFPLSLAALQLSPRSPTDALAVLSQHIKKLEALADPCHLPWYQDDHLPPYPARQRNDPLPTKRSREPRLI